jgi:hypothetical protein
MTDAKGKEITLGAMVSYGSISKPKTGRVIELTTKYKRTWKMGGYQETPMTTVKLEVKPQSYSGYVYRVRVKPENVVCL